MTSPTAATKATLRTLARRWHQLQAELDQLDSQLQELVAAAAPTLIALPGVGIDTAGQLLVTAGDNPQRLRSEVAFAQLCGTAPIPASSGRTDRHRLNRAGDRRAQPRLVAHRPGPHALPPGDQGRCRAADQQGLSKLDILRCLKRYIAREIYPHLTSPPPHHRYRLPATGAINQPHQQGHEERDLGMPLRVPVHRIAGRAGYWLWLFVALVVVAVAHRMLGPSSSVVSWSRTTHLAACGTD